MSNKKTAKENSLAAKGKDGQDAHQPDKVKNKKHIRV